MHCSKPHPPIADTEAYSRTVLEQGAIRFVAEYDGCVVGWCDITPRQQPGSSHIGHLGMGLLHEYRGKGIGYRILDATVREAFGKGLTRIDLEVFSSNQAAIALYRLMDSPSKAAGERRGWWMEFGMTLS